MSRDFMNLTELAELLGKNRHDLEKQVSRGKVPGRRVSGEWRFHKAEVTEWLEREMLTFDEPDLASLEKSQASPSSGSVGPIEALLDRRCVEVPLDAGTKPSVLKRLVTVAAEAWQVLDQPAVLQAIRNREDQMSTAMDGGVAVPHPPNRMTDALNESTIVFGRTVSGIPFGGPRRSLTDLFFLVLCRDNQTHLQALARLARLFQQANFLSGLREQEDADASWRFIVDADRSIGS